MRFPEAAPWSCELHALSWSLTCSASALRASTAPCFAVPHRNLPTVAAFTRFAVASRDLYVPDPQVFGQMTWTVVTDPVGVPPDVVGFEGPVLPPAGTGAELEPCRSVELLYQNTPALLLALLTLIGDSTAPDLS